MADVKAEDLDNLKDANTNTQWGGDPMEEEELLDLNFEEVEETVTEAETEEETTYTTEAGVYGRPTIYSSSYDEYNHTEILNILSGSDWTSDLDGR